MLFHETARRKMGERPCWLGALAVLPDIVVEISPVLHRFVARVMVPSTSGANSFHWAETEPLQLTELAKLFIDWHDDPEGALTKWWNEQPPDETQWAEGRTGGKKVIRQVMVPVGDVNVDDLGL